MSSFEGGFRPQRLLAIGAHSDDIEIGCGGTILKLIALNPSIGITWVVLAARDERRQEALDSAERFLAPGVSADVVIESFQERFFPHLPELKEYFDRLGRMVSPDLILCPWQGDAHQDHRTAAELTRNTFRNHLTLEYEILKVDGDLGRPVAYIDLPSELVDRKIDLILKGFPSQSRRSWFDPEAFRSLMRLRGVESQSGSGYAEAFHCRKLRLMSEAPT
jgi:LmbE family N-acetylglucosaminyl deacetylase